MSFVKNCVQCSYYRTDSSYCAYYARKVLTTGEALLCPSYTVSGMVNIAALGSLSGYLIAEQIPDALITTLKIADEAISTAKLQDSCVTGAKILDGTITGSKIADGTILAVDLEDYIVTNQKVAADAAIVESKLALNYPTHVEAHTLASHSSKNHSELEGVTSDQHHSQAHTLASHSSKNHSELEGVTTSQHHERYTDAEALAAVQAGNVNLQGDLSVQGGEVGIGGNAVPNYAIYAIRNTAADYHGNFQNSYAGVAMYLWLHANSQYCSFNVKRTTGGSQQQWNMGLYGSQNWRLANATLATYPIEVDASTGQVTISSTAPVIAKFTHSLVPHQIFAANGATMTTWYGAYYKMPKADTDCFLEGTFMVPDDWPSGTGRIRVMYMCTAAYSGKWSIAAHAYSESFASWNLLSASTAYDFIATSSNVFGRLTISGLSFTAGDVVRFQFQSDASNSQDLNIYAFYLDM